MAALVLLLTVCGVLQSNTTLKSLNLAYNGFGAEGAKALQDALKLNSTLMELDIM